MGIEEAVREYMDTRLADWMCDRDAKGNEFVAKLEAKWEQRVVAAEAKAQNREIIALLRELRGATTSD